MGWPFAKFLLPSTCSRFITIIHFSLKLQVGLFYYVIYSVIYYFSSAQLVKIIVFEHFPMVCHVCDHIFVGWNPKKINVTLLLINIAIKRAPQRQQSQGDSQIFPQQFIKIDVCVNILLMDVIFNNLYATLIFIKFVITFLFLQRTFVFPVDGCFCSYKR